MLSATPKSFPELAAALAQATAKTKVLAGGTDFIIKERAGRFAPDLLIYPGFIPELHEIRYTDTEVKIGAMVTMNEMTRAFKDSKPYCAIADAASKVGSPQIRCKATMAGNLCNASPAGDMLPIAWLYNAKLEVIDASGALSCISVQEFILGPQKNALKVDQAVTAIVLPRRDDAVSAFFKIGFRENVSISREGIACLLRTDAQGKITEARIVLGAVGSTPIRAESAEALMLGRALDDALREEVTPLVAQTVHDSCRPANRLYKTEAARGLVAEAFALLQARL